MAIPEQRYTAMPTIVPGLVLCAAVTLSAMIVEQAEIALLGGYWIESLVLAILIGVAVRSAVSLSAIFDPGIRFAAKTLLELGVVLLGASLSVAALRAAGLPLVAGIAALVALSLVFSFTLGRLFGLSASLATLVACGNSICGNSAIAAAAPVIGARPDDIAASIAFTALLGVGAVLVLPLLHLLFGLSGVQYGVFAGLTAYAVPQVLAATASAGTVSIQVGTLVKLIRVMMLGPVLFALGLIHGRGNGAGRIQLRHIFPWFIVGFVLMVALRSLGAIPEPALPWISDFSRLLTVAAMAALGLSVDIRSVAHAGGRVLWVASLSLVALAVMSLGLIALLGIA
jgi:uncharacterized integral membrane protein (TIGR00698 family)